MKKKLLLLAILVLLFIGFIAVRYFLLNQEAAEGKLKILSSPTASVFLDNVAIGKTPFEDKVKAGEHLVKLIPEGTATDTASWKGKIQVYKNALTFVDRELGSSDLSSAGVVFTISKMTTKAKSPDHGEIQVETEPAGSIVYLDNDEKGIASLLIKDVIKGEHELSVYSPGFFRRTQKINVESGFKIKASFKLALDPSQKKVVKLDENEEATESAKTKTFVVVKDTPTGWLRVREKPTLDASEAAKVNPGDEFELLGENAGWYKINYEEDKEGWISSKFSEKKKENDAVKEEEEEKITPSPAY